MDRGRRAAPCRSRRPPRREAAEQECGDDGQRDAKEREDVTGQNTDGVRSGTPYESSENDTDHTTDEHRGGNDEQCMRAYESAQAVR